jgi:hypothetical protein
MARPTVAMPTATCWPGAASLTTHSTLYAAYQRQAERFIQTSPREWAYAQPFETSAHRAQATLPRLTDYDASRPHSALGGKPPLSRIIGRTACVASTASDTAYPKPCFVGADGVKPRAATAAGGSGLTPIAPTQVQSGAGGDNLLGSDS